MATPRDIVYSVHPARHGTMWLANAWALFSRARLPWLYLLATYYLCMMLVDLVPVEEYKDVGLLSNLVNRHVLFTGSAVGGAITEDFAAALPKFVKVFPKDYRRVLEQNKLVQRQWELVNG